MSRRLRDWVVLTIAPLAALGLWLYLGVTSPGTLGSPVADLPAYFWPVRGWFGQSLAQGELPWWVSQVFGGTPFLANPQVAGFYPPNALFAVLPPAWAFNLLTLFHLVVPATATGFLARRRGASWAGAVFASILVALSGPALARVYGGHITLLAAGAWLPVGLLLIQKVLGRRPGRGGPLLAGVVALALVAGHPQMVIYGLMLGLMWIAGLLVESQQRMKDRVRPLIAIVAAAILGLGLAAIQIVPTLGYVAEASRQNLSLAERGSFSLPLFHMLGFLYPGRYGEGSLIHYWGGLYVWETTVFLGYPALVLAGLALVPGIRRRSPVTAPLVMALGILVIGLGNSTPLFEVLGRIPGLSSFRGPAKILYYLPVPMALLAAAGLDSLVRAIRHQSQRQMRIRMVGLAVGGVTAAGLLFVWGQISPTRVPDHLGHLGGSRQAVALRERAETPAVRQAVSIAADGAATSAALFALLTTAALVAVVGVPRRSRPWALGGLLILQGVHCADALRWTAATCRPEPPQLSSQLPPETESRIYFGGPQHNPNHLLGTGHGSPLGYDPLFPRVQGELIHAVNNLPRESFAGNSALSDTLKVAPVLGVTHVWHDGRVVALPQPAAGPRATLHQTVVWAPDYGRAWEILRQRWTSTPARQPDLAPPVVVHRGPTPPSWPSPSEVDTTPILQLSAQGASHLTIDILPPTAGVLLVRDTHMEGWTAQARTWESPAQPTEVLRANIAHRAVVLTQPASRVEFQYTPPGRTLGLILSLVALAIATVWAIGPSRRNPAPIAPTQDPKPSTHPT